MTKLLDRAIELARTLPEDVQDEIARMMLAAAQDEEPVLAFTPEEEASFEDSLALAERGEFVDRREIEAFFAQARK